MDDDDEQFWKRMYWRDNVSDDELVARMNAAPDMGGALLVELGEFIVRRAQARANGVSVGERQMRLSDVYWRDAQSDAQSMRGRVDCAFEAGYTALLAVLPESEHPSEHPSFDAIIRAYEILCGGQGPDVRMAGERYRAMLIAFSGDEREKAVRDARARYLKQFGDLPEGDELREHNVETAVRLATARYYSAEHNDLAEVLAWAERVRARAKQFVEINRA